MSVRARYIPILAAILILTACAPGRRDQSSRFGSAISNEERGRMEVITPRDELIAELKKSPTDFVLTVPENKYAWERAQMFFKEHTSGSRFSAGKGDTIILSNSGKQDPISYAVTKKTGRDGTAFSVRCDSKGTSIRPNELALQCKNLARFIKDGVLEKSLI